MSQALVHQAKSLAHKSTPGHFVRRFNTRRVVSKFADDLGMVYFGRVDQSDDEHRLLRGMTTTHTHSDHHYAVGTYRGYDMAVVVRRDTLTYPDKRLKDHFWTIMTFDLHTTYELPHMYIATRRIREELLARVSNLIALTLGRTVQYPPAFADTYIAYGAPDRAIEIEQLLRPDMAASIASHFTEMSVEVSENTIYLYIAEKHPSRALLEKMTNNGLYLAQAFDASAEEFARYCRLK